MLYFYRVVLFALCGIVLVNAGNSFSHHGKSRNGDNQYDYLLFVQRWPASACINGSMGADSHQHCALASNISTTDWVLHGLWPSKNHSIGPEDCNATAAFVLKPLIPLYDQLTIFWPNFETNTAFGSFWAHEWVKHGTCAQDIPELKGEFNFFNMPLQFRKKYDLFNALFEQNIAPSATKTFSHDQFTAALEAAFNERIEVYCSYSSRTKLHYVAEIRICMTKDLQLMECPAQSGNEMSSCPKGQNLMYPPVIVPKLNSGGEPNFKHRGSVRGSHRKSA